MKTYLAHLKQEIAALLPGTRVRRARNTYNATAVRAMDTYAELDSRAARHPHARGRLISGLAALEYRMADQYRAGWHTLPQDKGIADSYASGSVLLDLIASTEVAESIEFRNHGPEDWEDAFGHVLDDLTGVTDLAVRAELMTRLYLAAHPVVGGDVAETISRLGTAYVRSILNGREQDAADAQFYESVV